jgi:predicted metal-binding membrane protein
MSDVRATGQRTPRGAFLRHAVFQRAGFTFYGICALLFAASATVTLMWCASMSAMGGMPMPGGWTMSMAWLPMCGQTWPGVAASFLGMWLVMMVAMMLPSLAPALWRYREALAGAGQMQPDRLTLLAGTGYFFIWALLGLAAFAVGAALSALEMQLSVLARAVPVVAGMVVLGAGALQFTSWKVRHLGCCREAPGYCDCELPTDAGAAWRYGLRLGLHCSYCCAGLTSILLVAGVMNVWVMAGVTAAITIERLAPFSEDVARVIGVVIVSVGLALVGRAVGLG